MYLRIIHGRLKPGAWDAFEQAYKRAVTDAGPVQGLVGRWLTRDLDDGDSGTTISLWATQEAMDAYEKSDTLKNRITAKLSPFFSGEYTTTKSHVLYAEGDPSPVEWVGSDS
ncbi:MAG: antibiotic biosynthesis monooxygenase family protein [Hyphomicrobiales bacterium]|nr:antibiotic biosynthesis monooxygenase family protein [Hyphomicrobiales bacterium]